NQSVIAPLECARARIQPSAPQHEVSRVYSFTNVRCWSSCFSMSAAPNSLNAELQQIRGPNQKTLIELLRKLLAPPKGASNSPTLGYHWHVAPREPDSESPGPAPGAFQTTH